MDEELEKRRKALAKKLGRQPTLPEVFPRDFTATGRWLVRDLGAAPKPKPRGRRRVKD